MSDNDEMIKGVLFSGVGNVLQHRTWDLVKQRLKKNVNVFLTRYVSKKSVKYLISLINILFFLQVSILIRFL